jgi:hypothetical protein
VAASVAHDRSPVPERRDGWLAALAAAQGALLLGAPSVLLVAIGLWWNANTVAHNFIHRPFFRARWANALLSAYLSLLLGFPQTLWRERHLAHHAGAGCRARPSGRLALETSLILLLWAGLAALSPAFLLRVYLPGYLLGLALCCLQGYYEHTGGTTSHYGRVYNALFLNDGYHVEHHTWPHARWSDLPGLAQSSARTSRWPAVLRWLDALSLEGLERWVVRSPARQRFVVARHAAAARRLVSGIPDIRRVKIVGGGLFPRTALILSDLLPEARITIVDGSASNLDVARIFLGGRAVELVHGLYRPSTSEDADLLVIPLSYSGEREEIYRHPPARAVLIHDWIWRRRGEGAVVSWLLLKRMNLVR